MILSIQMKAGEQEQGMDIFEQKVDEKCYLMERNQVN